MDQAIEQAPEIDTGSPLVMDHGERVSESHVPDVNGAPSELELHKRSRGFVKTEKPVDPPPTPDPAPLPEAAADAQPAAEPKKPERWNDPDTGDTYDMRHKVARRIKTVLSERGEARARAEAAEKRVEELTKVLIDRGQSPARAEAQAQAHVDANAEPDPADTTKYPEGQYDRAYVKDMALWAADQKNRELSTTLRTERGQEAAAAAEHAQVIRWQQTALPEATKKYPDFADQLAKFPNTPEHEPIKEMMFGSPVGNDVVYAVGADPKLKAAYDHAPRDSRGSQERARVRLLSHVEAQILSRRQTRDPAAQPSTTAPAPIAPVHAGAGPSGPLDWSKDDPDQYQRWKQTRGQRR